MEELLNRITINPQVAVDKPVIHGARITVDSILRLLAAGMKPEEIAEDYGTETVIKRRPISS